MNDEEELEIIIPVIQKKITHADLLLGKTIEPIKRLQVISEDDFEDLVCEWATGYLAQTYVKVRRCGGAVRSAWREGFILVCISSGLWLLWVRINITNAMSTVGGQDR